MTNSVTATISVGAGPISAVASPDSTQVYVACSQAGSVSVISTATHAVTATISVPGAGEVVFHPAGVLSCVNGQGASQLFVIYTAGKTVIATIATGAAATGLAVTPDGSHLYLTPFTPKSASSRPTSAAPHSSSLTSWSGPPRWPLTTGAALTTNANGTGQAAFTITGLAPGSHNVVIQVNNPSPAPGSCYYINATANPNATSGIPVITTT